ncbi:Hypothetical protein, putative [Bodo saltans]|uniref:Uncharacterized protein n=1 Tax=Bodo saltans TaxID=75058 RepID=A0A0S4J2A4_BODSA|nr:Hypothetical protein, putative [Bodo saltans]|eukprot:CUG06040.1 Hypothetical protein, putative [Bodo saltans]
MHLNGFHERVGQFSHHAPKIASMMWDSFIAASFSEPHKTLLQFSIRGAHSAFFCPNEYITTVQYIVPESTFFSLSLQHANPRSIVLHIVSRRLCTLPNRTLF